MAIKGRYAQVSNTSHGCNHEELITIVDDGWKQIECAICKKRWDWKRRSPRDQRLGFDARIVTIEPHPGQTSHNPGCWAVQFCVSREGQTQMFWRWHTVRRLNDNGAYVTPGNDPPTVDEVLASFWDDVFSDLHGFNFKTALFQKEEPEKP